MARPRRVPPHGLAGHPARRVVSKGVGQAAREVHVNRLERSARQPARGTESIADRLVTNLAADERR